MGYWAIYPIAPWAQIFLTGRKAASKYSLPVGVPAGATVTASLTDEPGSRVIAAVEQYKDAYKNLKGMPYVAVLIGPPPEPPAAPTDRAIADER